MVALSYCSISLAGYSWLSYLGAHGLVSYKTNGSTFNKATDQLARTPVVLTLREWWLKRCEHFYLKQGIPQAQADVGRDPREARRRSKSTVGSTEGNDASQSAGQEKGRAYCRGQEKTL